MAAASAPPSEGGPSAKGGNDRRLMARVLVAAALVAAAGPAAAADLAFKYRTQHVEALRGYHNQPYWKVLAECAGIYGSLVGRYEAAGDAPRAQAARRQGVGFANAAMARLRADRGVGPGEALDLIRDEVETGRASSLALLGSGSVQGLRHEQVLDLFCTQVDEAHARAARFR